MSIDSFYYEKLFESLFPKLKRFEIEEEIEKVVDEIKKTFKNIEVEYEIRYGVELVFNLKRHNYYDWNISFDLSRLDLQHKDDLKRFLTPRIKIGLLEHWDSQILNYDSHR